MILLEKYPKGSFIKPVTANLYYSDAFLSLACCFHGDERLNSGEKWEHVLQLIKKIGMFAKLRGTKRVAYCKLMT